jgi:GT2 family glycosyltransferase
MLHEISGWPEESSDVRGSARGASSLCNGDGPFDLEALRERCYRDATQLIPMAPPFSIIVPTYRRAEMMARVLPSYLATGAAEVILVDDASGLPHARVLEGLARQQKVRLVAFPEHRGLPSGRNAGLDAVTTDWAIFGEDDVWFPPEYPSTLIEHAGLSGAPVASGSAPFADPALLDGPVEDLHRAIREAPGLGQHALDEFLGTPWPAERLPNGDLVTPLLTAGAAIHRSVFERIRFDPGFGGNAFREETDFFFSCAEAGVRTIRCVHARCGHMKSHARAAGGGSWAMSRPRFAWHMAANNWRLLRKHRALVAEARAGAGASTGPLAIQSGFVWGMLRSARSPRP